MKKILYCFLATCIIYTTYGQDELAKAENLILNSNFQDAVDLLDRSLKMEREFYASVTLENKKAEALTRMGKFNEADHLLQSIQRKLSGQENPYLTAVTKSNIGFLQLHQGQNETAERLLQEAIAGFESTDSQSSLEAAQALAYLGLVYVNTGKYAQAEEQLQIALSLRKEKLNESHELIAATYNDLGLVYSQIDKDKALDYFELAISMYKNIHGADHPKIAIANINTGIIYRDLTLYGDAIDNFESALKTWEKVYPGAHQTKAIALYNLGQTYLKMGYQKGASGYYEQALTMYEAVYGKKHPEVANVLNAIGNLELSQNMYDNALTTYQKAIEANIPDFHSHSVTDNPSLKNYYHGARLLQSLLFKAQALEARYSGKSIKFSDLQQALTVLHLCDSLIDKLRRESTNESDKILIGATANEVYADGVRIAHEAAMNAFNKRPYYQQSFYFAEKSKSAVLLEAISDANAKSFSGIPAELLDEENKLKSAIASCAQKLAQRPSAEEETYLRQVSFELNRNYNQFIQDLEKNYPGYFDLKYNQASPSVHDLQSLMDDESLLLSYFQDEKNNRLYIFQISNNKFSVEDKPLPADFDKKITGLRNSLYYSETSVYKSAGRELHELLIPKTARRFTRLIIVPVGRLGVIPFETLLTKDSDVETEDFKKFPYLMLEKRIQYEFSAGLIVQKARQKNNTTIRNSIMLCAPVAFSSIGLADLPGTEAEVNTIDQLFKSKSFPSTLLTRENATERALKKDDLSQYNFLHLATHGLVDEENPELSRIFMQSETAGQDGSLYTGEIYNLNLDASLVTLSACETGLGKISKGEGVIGLSRALIYAGADNIIVSFWSVADQSTSALMKELYKRILEKPLGDYCSSLHEAKLSLINGNEYSAPYYWAPFILIGF